MADEPVRLDLNSPVFQRDLFALEASTPLCTRPRVSVRKLKINGKSILFQSVNVSDQV